MAVVIFNPNPKNKKPKKEFIDLSVAHRNHKKMHKSYKVAFFVLLLSNITTLLYIYFKKLY